MPLVQYITKKRQKVFLDMQDLNIIRQRVNSIYNPKAKVINLDALKKCNDTLTDIEYYSERVGVMISSPPSDMKPGVILIGYSLCNPKDKFDHKMIYVQPGIMTYHPHEHLGKNIAKARAFKWAMTGGSKILDYVKSVPESIHDDLAAFMGRSARYYQGDSLPEWADLFLRVHYDKKRSG